MALRQNPFNKDLTGQAESAENLKVFYYPLSIMKIWNCKGLNVTENASWQARKRMHAQSAFLSSTCNDSGKQ